MGLTAAVTTDQDSGERKLEVSPLSTCCVLAIEGVQNVLPSSRRPANLPDSWERSNLRASWVAEFTYALLTRRPEQWCLQTVELSV